MDKDMDAFLSWLSGIACSGGGFSEAATCEGLAEALTILQGGLNTAQNHQNHEAQKHCILVSASNPYPLPTPVYCLPIQSTDHKENNESSKEPSIADAEKVAKSFAQCSVSLSVISPKQLPTLKAIYNAGKRNPRAADPSIDHAKNPHFLVLLSENFIEARTALSRPLHGNLVPNQNITKMDSAPSVTMPGPASNANPSVNGTMMGRQPVVGGITTANVKVEPATIPAMASAPTFSHITPISNIASQGVSALQSSSPSLISQEANIVNDSVHEQKPNIGVHMSSMISSGMTSAPSVMSSVAGSGQPIGTQQMGGISGNQNVMNGLGTTTMSSAPAMMPTPGMAQQAGVNSLGVTNSAAMNMPIGQHPNAQQPQPSKYVKIWEGTLSGQRQGQPVFICKLEGYRSGTASEMLAADWPETMQIVRLIAQEHMNNKQYVGKADFLVFRTLNQHGFLGQLQEKKLCAVIQLPSQTLLLSVADKAGRLIGMLFPGDMVVFKPQVPTQQPAMQQQQLQHHMHMQQQGLPLQQQQLPQIQQQQPLPQQMQQQQQPLPQQMQPQQQQPLQQQMQPQPLQPLQPQMQQMQQQPQQPLQQQMQQMQQQPQQLPLQQQQMQQIQQQQQQQMQQMQHQQHHQQMQQMQQQQQQQPQQPQMVGTGMGQQFMQGHNRAVQMMQGKMAPQGPGSMPGGGFLP
ncbi:hypothetical protein QOZ80_UnG0725520 [Eleusine coracana subsp. coracana]|uniref:Mediator of RNA polymerase II transcription subunit 25 n=1 Tax=Eleusine coracana subsp. coracana TaxID=191504 RepID=A0AAV9FUD4_ELECO|nr:hypothetical protein QOZ80_UnG0725520 [Eleusine coracana subsp. coracana]